MSGGYEDRGIAFRKQTSPGEHAVRQTAVDEQLRERLGRGRRVLGRLPHDRIATDRCDGAVEHVGFQGVRQVPVDLVDQRASITGAVVGRRGRRENAERGARVGVSANGAASPRR